MCSRHYLSSHNLINMALIYKIPQLSRLHQRFVLRCITLRMFSSLKLDKAYVDGKWVSAASGKTFEVVNPATGQVIGSVPDMDQSDAKTAIKAAHTAFKTWKNTLPKERAALMRKWYDLSIKHKKELAALLTEENGKPLVEADGEVLYGTGFLEWFGEECRRTYGDVVPTPIQTKRTLVIKQPVGVAGMITPWNFPNAMVTRKAGAAIAAGCTVVLRPAEDTPYSALALCKLAEEAGFPPGVLNIVTSSRENAGPIGKEFCESPLVSKISFTGSTAVGKLLLSQSADTVKKVSLELGGNAPFIVFESADLQKAIIGLIACKFRNAGQTCVCANRILVQEGIYDKFVHALALAIQSTLKTGNGMEPDVNHGPLINSRALEKVDGLVKDAVACGAKVIVGGKRDAIGGNFYEPTLLSDVTVDMRVVKEEIFGPVAAIVKFKTEAEALEIANNTTAGLASYFFTTDIAQAWRVSEKLQYGLVGVNEGLVSAVESTFGGWKESGLGSEGGKYGLDEYLVRKNICYGGITP